MNASATAYLCCDGASGALDFYARAFGAVELSRLPSEDGRLGHAGMRIGDSAIFLSDVAENNIREPNHFGGNSVSLVLSVSDADAAFERALDAGARVERPVSDEPFGRSGWLYDPRGHHWCVMAPAREAPGQ